MKIKRKDLKKLVRENLKNKFEDVDRLRRAKDGYRGESDTGFEEDTDRLRRAADRYPGESQTGFEEDVEVEFSSDDESFEDFFDAEDGEQEEAFSAGATGSTNRRQGALSEKAPEGWEQTVKKMKSDPEIDNPYALAHWMKDKGYQPGGKNESKLIEKAWKSFGRSIREQEEDNSEKDSAKSLPNYWEKLKSSRGLSGYEESRMADASLAKFLLRMIEAGTRLSTQQAIKHMQEIVAKLKTGDDEQQQEQKQRKKKHLNEQDPFKSSGDPSKGGDFSISKDDLVSMSSQELEKLQADVAAQQLGFKKQKSPTTGTKPGEESWSISSTELANLNPKEYEQFYKQLKQGLKPTAIGGSTQDKTKF